MEFRIYATIYLSEKFPKLLGLNDRIPSGRACNCPFEGKENEECGKICPIENKHSEDWNNSEQSYLGFRVARTRAQFVEWWCSENDDSDETIGQANEMWTDYINCQITLRGNRRPFAGSFKSFLKTIELPDNPNVRTFVIEAREDPTFPFRRNTLDVLIDYISREWGDPDTAVDSLERLWIDYRTALPLDSESIGDI